jgi:IMP cyclohydrolase
MNIYKINDVGALLAENAYPGRGIIAGMSEDGKSAVTAYFIMGRSANSRNRVFIEEGEELRTAPFDASKVEDPSLIIYYPVRKIGNSLIVTNGDQTDTIRDALKVGGTFEGALETRQFEPDEPNFTPRISAMLTFGADSFTYKMSILKSIDEKGSDCARYTYSYAPKAGLGHFIHTYACDGNPIPTFQGEPERVALPNTAEELRDILWQNLNSDNKISLFVRYIDLADGKTSTTVINKNK